MLPALFGKKDYMARKEPKGKIKLSKYERFGRPSILPHCQFKLAPNCKIFQPYFSRVTSLQNITRPKLSSG